MYLHIFIFIAAILFRSTSGAQNGFGYSRNHLGVLFMSVFLWLMTMAMWHISVVNQFINISSVIGIASLACIAMSGLFGGLMYFLLVPRLKGKSLHAIELLVTSLNAIGLILISPIAVVLAHPIGMSGHTILKNVAGPWKWNYYATDDPTGETWGIFSPDWLIGRRLFCLGLERVKYPYGIMCLPKYMCGECPLKLD